MRHEEILGNMAAYRAGSLTPSERSALEGHLAVCGLCRELTERWKDEAPSPGFTSRVMLRLNEEKKTMIPLNRTGWALKTGWAVAAALLVAAFWHPEKSWVQADRSFAFFGPTEGLAHSHPLFSEGARHE